MPAPDPDIQSWFTELAKYQQACINNSAGKLNPYNFANAVILTYLPSAADQNNFLAAIGSDLQTSDLTTYKTFKALLDYSLLLENAIFNALQALSVPALQDIDSVPYYATPIATAFPGGSTGPAWLAAQGVLMASIDPTCYTLPFRIKVNQTVDKAGATMKDLIPQIAGLG